MSVMDETPKFSRLRDPNATEVELRFAIPVEWAGLMDGYSLGNGEARNRLAKRILGEWVKKEAHRAMLIARTVGGNPTLSDLAGMEVE